MANFGLTLDDVRPTDIPLWAEHLPVVDVFEAMGTQWMVGMNGPTGLNYQALPFILRLHGVKRDKWALMFQDIRVLEQASLAEMHRG